MPPKKHLVILSGHAMFYPHIRCDMAVRPLRCHRITPDVRIKHSVTGCSYSIWKNQIWITEIHKNEGRVWYIMPISIFFGKGKIVKKGQLWEWVGLKCNFSHRICYLQYAIS